MLRARVVPCLLIRDGGLVKTRKFGDDKYVGDPINAVRIFNEKEVDELIVCDIDATMKNAEPNYAVIENLAAECRMPLCYGGGVTTPEQATRIMGLGVEKVAISAGAIARPELIADLADKVGRQSVVVVLDVKKRTFGGYQLKTHNGTRAASTLPLDFARKAERLGAGEIVINSIDHDGMMDGYDLDFAQQIRAAVDVPITVLGGAGSWHHMESAVRRLGTVGVAAGSFFVFKGPFRAVLINYLSTAERRALQDRVPA